jgi:hypothetical protein
VIRLAAYLLGVAAMGTIAQGAVGSALHDVMWATKERIVQGEARVVTETTTVEAASRGAGAPGEPAPTHVATIFVTVPGRTTTTTVPGPAVTTTVSGDADTVSTPGSSMTTTVPGPSVTTTVPGPTTTLTVPGPTRTTTVQGPVVTTTTTGPTETVTVTVTEACDPPPKKPSNPPCPPHK